VPGITQVGDEQPSRIGKYDVDAIVGRGGMGVVYRGHDTLGRQVAIKMVLASIAGESELIQRFHREAQFTANLHHPNIVTVYDWGQEGNSPFIVMEYLDGRSLDRWRIDGPPPLVLLKKLNIIEQVCAGLNYAHERKIVHRDIKPANIFVLDDDSVKLVDFGVARLAEGEDHAMTRTGQVLGSLYYMSPEQANGIKLDHRTDIFSTGVVLYQLLAGVLPFVGRDAASTMIRILTAAPQPLSEHLADCPQELEDVVRRALEKAPRDRYQTAEELAFDLSLVQTQLRRQVGAEYLASAEAAVERSDWAKAREILVELLKLDREHARGLDLLREVQQIIRRQTRASEAASLKAHAEDAFAKRRFKAALDFAEEAVSLDNSDYDLVVLRDEIRDTLSRSEKARLAAERAESSLHAQRLEAAQDAVNEALSLDPYNTTARQLQATIAQALAEQFKRGQVQSLLGQARDELAERRYASALVLLRKVESIDEQAFDLRLLLQQATQGQERERRERELNSLAGNIRKLISSVELDLAGASLSSALGRYPDEPVLLELDRQLSEVRRKEAIRLAVERTERCLLAGRWGDAQSAVKEALGLDPSNAQAQQLQSKILQAFAEQARRSQERSLLGQARQALALKRWAGALDLLTKAENLNAGTPDLQAMIQQAREGQERENRQRELNDLSGAVRELLSGKIFDRAAAQLTGALRRFPGEPQLLELERQLAELRPRPEPPPRNPQHDETESQAKNATAWEAAERPEPTRLDAILPFQETLAQTASDDVLSAAPPPTLLCEAPYCEAPYEEAPPEPAQQDTAAFEIQPEIAESGLPRPEKRQRHGWLVWASLGVAVLGGLLLAVKLRNPAPAPIGNSVDLSIATAPEGANIQVRGNGQSLDCVTPRCALSLPPGNYNVTATLSGYLPAVQSLNAAPGMGAVEIRMTPKPLSGDAGGAEAALVVQTPGVQDAMVYVDGTAYATSGTELHLNGALNKTYRVRVEKDGYEPSPEQVIALAHPTETIVVRLKQLANAATLVLHNATPHADVLIDGKDVGAIAANGAFETTVPPGWHNLQLAAGRASSNPLSRQFSPRERVEISTLTIPVQPPPQPQPPQPKPQPAPPSPAPSVDTAAQDWEAVKSSNDGNQLNAFLQRHPTGPYADRARARQEELDWYQTSASNDRGRLQAYLQRHGSGGHAQQAREQLEQLDWDAVKNSGDEQRLQGYLNGYPQGRYAATARTLLQSIRDRNAAEAKKNQDATNARKNQEALDARKNQQAADERGVREAMAAYRQAYENRSIDQLRRIWPAMTAQQANENQNTFQKASAIQMTLQEKSLRVTGDTAQSDCAQTMQITVEGRKYPVANSATFFFQRRAGGWVIERVVYGKAR